MKEMEIHKKQNPLVEQTHPQLDPNPVDNGVDTGMMTVQMLGTK